MKVNIGGYVVEVKAKGYGNTCFNTQDTLSFLCHLCVELINARDKYELNGFDGCANATQRDVDAIRSILDENNYDPTK